MRGAVTILTCAVIFSFGDALNLSSCPRDATNESLLPHQRCNRFYQCVGDELVEQRCAANLLFNTEKQLCDWPDNVNCGARDNNESEEIIQDEPENGNVNDDPRQAPILCGAEDSDGVLVSHDDCSKYYICASGIPVPMSCPPDLVYNPFIKKCDWPENYKCIRFPGNNINHEDDDFQGNYDPSQAPALCAAEGSDGVLVAHEYCNRFYICTSGNRVVISCPPKLLYNPRKEQCDWPKNVNCARRLIPDANDVDNDRENDDNADVSNSGPGNNDPSLAPEICAAEGSNGVLVAHEYCNKFYKCSWGLPVAIECQSNLFYNPRTEQCDWPQNVDCSGRQ